MPETCGTCGASLASAADLVVHMREKHPNANPATDMAMNPAAEVPYYTCGLCGGHFPSAEALAQHNLTREERRKAREATSARTAAPT